jgi:DnaJ like chaperone protein
MYYQRYTNGGNYFWILFLLFIIFGGFRILLLLFGIAMALLINFFPLLIMGAIAYQFIKKANRNRFINSSLNTKSSDHKQFVELMVHILICIAKADGHISAAETQIIRQFFITQLHFSGAQLEWLNDTIASAKNTQLNMDALAKEFNSQFGYESQLMLLNMVYNVAYSDGQFHSSESQAIDRLAQLLGISVFDHQRIKMAFEAQFGKSNTTDTTHYAILGLQPSATKAEIKTAYRELSKKYHPDKVHHLGPEFKQQAEAKMKEINTAYDVLTKQTTA